MESDESGDLSFRSARSFLEDVKRLGEEQMRNQIILFGGNYK